MWFCAVKNIRRTEASLPIKHYISTTDLYIYFGYLCSFAFYLCFIKSLQVHHEYEHNDVAMSKKLKVSVFLFIINKMKNMTFNG